MAGRRTNLALLGALALALITGWTAFAAGTWWGQPVVLFHGLVGLAVVALAPWKSLVARRGLQRARRGKAASLLLALLVLVSLVAGVAHSLGRVRPIAGLSPMQLHVGAALLAIPFAVAHLIQRPVGVRRTDIGRRNLLRGLGVLAGGGAIYLAVELTARAMVLPGRNRRFTGSHEVGSHDLAAMPVTQWLNDRVPSLGAGEWRLAVRSSGRERLWSLDELSQGRTELTATLDCTGGWYAEQSWNVTPLTALLTDAAGRSVVVRSTTGYARRFPTRDLDRLYLATGVGGRPLSAGHGYPARLVAPGRRGFWWVKWVDLITVDDRPWWLQLPFPTE